MAHIAHTQSNDAMLKDVATLDGTPGSSSGEAIADAQIQGVGEEEEARAGTPKKRRPWERKRKSYSHAHYKVYKRRWFGLAQLVLLNIVASWDVSDAFLEVVAVEANIHGARDGTFQGYARDVFPSATRQATLSTAHRRKHEY